jgi:hypothetical protein
MITKSEHVSPFCHPFVAPVPIWMQIGTAEVFSKDVKQWVFNIKIVRENTIELYEVENGMHNTFITVDLRSNPLRPYRRKTLP